VLTNTTRRDLLKTGTFALAGTGLKLYAVGVESAGGGASEGTAHDDPKADSSEWKPGELIGYINAEAPKVELLPYQGETYDATVPDTLDLAERARIAVHVLTEVAERRADYECYDIFYPLTDPPSMRLNQWYFPYEEGHMEALSRNRLASGSAQNLHIEQRWMEVALKIQGRDGLIYVPVNGRPWAFVDFQIRDVAKPVGGQYLEPYLCGCMLRTLSFYSRRDPNGPWKDATRRLVDGMRNLAVFEGDYAYFYPSIWYMTAKEDWPSKPPMPTRPIEAESSNVALGLVDAYNALGYEPALDFARKHINYLRKNFYGPDGTFYSMPGLAIQAHGGAHLRGLLAMEQCAEAARDKELMAFVVQAYEHARFLGANYKFGTSDYDIVVTPGAGLVGFFPEWTSSPDWQTSETDQVVDQMTVALRLSEAGEGDYWDDADRAIRNQLAENQLVDIDWIYKASKSGPPAEKAYYASTDSVPERIRGAFAANPSVNDWAGRGVHSAIAGCCTAYGCNGLFWAWERILRYQNGELKVNLLLNRASPWADVDSYIPYVGRVDVKVKKPVNLSIRIPEWVTPGVTQCRVNDQDRTLEWGGRYAKVGDVKPGDIVRLTFPISERTDVVSIEKKQYTLIRKGNDVVSIDPPGVYHPLYQRQHYRQNEPRMRKVTRFVSKEIELT
jgi:hypothetical protein